MKVSHLLNVLVFMGKDIMKKRNKSIKTPKNTENYAASFVEEKVPLNNIKSVNPEQQK